MSDTSEETSWYDQAVATAEETYDSAAETVVETYDSAAETVVETYDSAAETVVETYDSAAETVVETYDSAASAVNNYSVWTTDGTAPPEPPFCPDPEDPELGKHLGYAAVHVGADVVLHYFWHAASKVTAPLTAAYLIYEISWAMGDAATAEYHKQLCGEYYEYLAQLAYAGECPQAFQGICNADHDGGGPWYGPMRMNSAEAIDDVNAHVYEFPDHQVDEGDATVEPVAEDKYAAGCNADHGGTSWSGPERDTFDEAADDLVAHLEEWPDHTLDTDYGQPGARVGTRTRDPYAPGGYR